MADYAAADIAEAMRRAGFPESEIPTGVAVSLTENGSRQLGRTNHSQIEHSVGPWQINLYVPGTGKIVHGNAISEAGASDLQESTDYAYRLWKAHGWQPWSVYTNGSYKGNLGNAGAVQADLTQPITPARVAELAQAHGGSYTVAVKNNSDRIKNPQYADPIERALGAPEYVANPDPVYEVVFANGKKIEVRGERGADGQATGNWIPTGGDTSALRPSTTGTTGWHWVPSPDGGERAVHSDGSPVIDPTTGMVITKEPKASTETAAQYTQRMAAAESSAASAALARGRLAELGKPKEPTPLDPVTAALRGAQTTKAELDAIKAARDMLPKQLLALQEADQTMAAVAQQYQSGQITLEQMNHYRTAVTQNLESALRGTTPAAEEKIRQEETTKRAQIGRDLLNQRVSSGTKLAGDMYKEYRGLLTDLGGYTEPGATLDFNPLVYSQALTESLGGGPGMSELAQILLQAASPTASPFTGGGAAPNGTGPLGPLRGIENGIPLGGGDTSYQDEVPMDENL